jgi:hypothetical protein
MVTLLILIACVVVWTAIGRNLLNRFFNKPKNPLVSPAPAVLRRPTVGSSWMIDDVLGNGPSGF